MAKDVIVLEHDTRRMIYNHIKAHPGVSFVVLKKVFDLNDSTLRYHLNYLKKNEKISFGLESGKRYYYPHLGQNHAIKTSEASEHLETIDLTGVQERIITMIKRHPGINQKELIKRTGINRLTLSKNLKKLLGLCIVRKIPNGNKVNYEYIGSNELRHEILKRLLVKLLYNEIDEDTFLELRRKLN